METEPKICFVSQGYKQNPNAIFYDAGGHSGVDEVCGWASDIYSLKYGEVFKILDNEHPANDGSGYWGVFIIGVDDDGSLCEWQIGHCSEIFVKPGDQVTPWTIVGKEGNKGRVFSGGQVITKEMQDAGSRAGSHRHWNKKLVAKKTYEQYDTSGGQFLTAFAVGIPSAYKDKNGFYYEVLDYNNGLKGSVDPMPDLLIGYEKVRQHLAKNKEEEITPAEAAVISSGLKTVSWAIKFPSLWGLAMNLLKSLSAFLGRSR